MDEALADFAPVYSGVSQGSVVGPCFFLAFINDLPATIKSKVRLFADDTMCTSTTRKEADQKVLQDDLNSLAIWEKQWAMEIHPQKCSTLCATRRRSKMLPSYQLHGHTLENANTVKYLGVNVQDDLTWGTHITAMTNTANKTLGFLR